MDQSPQSQFRLSRRSRRWLIAVALLAALDRLLRFAGVSETIRIAIFGLALVGLIGWELIRLWRKQRK